MYYTAGRFLMSLLLLLQHVYFKYVIDDSYHYVYSETCI